MFVFQLYIYLWFRVSVFAGVEAIVYSGRCRLGILKGKRELGEGVEVVSRVFQWQVIVRWGGGQRVEFIRVRYGSSEVRNGIFFFGVLC